jgi:hypothetical protein
MQPLELEPPELEPEPELLPEPPEVEPLLDAAPELPVACEPPLEPPPDEPEPPFPDPPPLPLGAVLLCVLFPPPVATSELLDDGQPATARASQGARARRFMAARSGPP